MCPPATIKDRVTYQASRSDEDFVVLSIKCRLATGSLFFLPVLVAILLVSPFMNIQTLEELLVDGLGWEMVVLGQRTTVTFCQLLI